MGRNQNTEWLERGQDFPPPAAGVAAGRAAAFGTGLFRGLGHAALSGVL